MKGLWADSDLTPTTPLYRYLTIESFISCVEAKQLHLTQANLWEDTWEMITRKVPLVDAEGKSRLPSIHEDIYGQCWSRLKESDAMWRIYSPSKTGVQISTSVEKFKSLDGIEKCYLGSVVYFETIPDLLEKMHSRKNHPYDFALHKRMAFNHEREVRLLTHGQSLPTRPARIALPFDPCAFIEGVTLDPRAEDWYVNTIARYCERVGLAVRPVKSSLYEPDPHLKVGLVGSWIPIKKDV
jgi:hypothetical protein